MQFQAARARFDLFDQWRLVRGVSLSQETEIHGPGFGALQHSREIPCAGSAGGSGGSGGRAGAAADHGGDAVGNRFVNLLRGNEMDVAIDAACGDDQVFACDHFGGCADDQLWIDSVHRVGISGFAHFHDAAVLDADIGFHDAPMIEDDGVGDDQVERAIAGLRGWRCCSGPCRRESLCRRRM